MEQEATGLESVRRLADGELIAGLRRLVRADQVLMARLLVHLGEVDARGLYRDLAFQSMFAYAVEELHMSEAEAYLRIQVARLGREFPLVLRMLESRANTVSAQNVERAPRAMTGSARMTQTHSRYVPRAVVREVYERDGGQCTFVSPDGRQCAAQGFLELHHDMPYARGGSATAANLRTVCRTHNALFAERDFGRAFMQTKLAQARQRKRGSENKQVPERPQG
jgi:5-methylcytosine-specific restriction endonuclease McrA